MKKMVLGLSLALAAFGFLLSPALAADNPQRAVATLSAADQAFLASLALPAAPTPAAQRPKGGLEKALCHAAANCASGTVSCDGNNSTASCTGVDRNCAAGERGHVTCDGVTTWCPTTCTDCGPDFCTGRQDCIDSCYPCFAIYMCNATTCTDTCRCKFSTCPQ